MKVDKVTPLNSERNVNLEKAGSLNKNSCGCTAEDSGSSQPIFH